MGRRHGKNQTNASVYSYQERKKDAQQSGFGVLHERLGKDSIKEFDCCCLTLQPCRDPVCTKEGFLFEKEAILEYILREKRENIRKLKEWDKQRKRQAEEEKELARALEEERRLKFIKQEVTPARETPSDEADTKVGTSDSVSNMTEGRNTQLPSFWLPSQMPQADAAKMDKPDQNVYCPMSHKKLKMKDLIPVKFTPILNDESGSKDVAKKVRYMCAVTHDVLTNVTPVCLLKTSGVVVTQECVDKLLRKDMIDPTNDQPIREEDIIPLQRGGTGFAHTNKEKLTGKLNRPQLELH